MKLESSCVKMGSHETMGHDENKNIRREKQEEAWENRIGNREIC